MICVATDIIQVPGTVRALTWTHAKSQYVRSDRGRNDPQKEWLELVACRPVDSPGLRAEEAEEILIVMANVQALIRPESKGDERSLTGSV